MYIFVHRLICAKITNITRAFISHYTVSFPFYLIFFEFSASLDAAFCVVVVVVVLGAPFVSDDAGAAGVEVDGARVAGGGMFFNCRSANSSALRMTAVLMRS